MDGDSALLDSARAAYDRGEWHVAHEQLQQARAEAELTTADLGLLGSAAWWAGDVRESLVISEEVYHRLQDDGDPAGAAMKALNLGLLWFTDAGFADIEVKDVAADPFNVYFLAQT